MDTQSTTSPDISPNEPEHNNKKTIIGLIAVLVLILVGSFIYFKPLSNTQAISEPANIQTAEVSITRTGFVPSTVSVKAGQAVVWTNSDSSPHVVASDPYPSDNKLRTLNSLTNISPNDTYSFVFNTRGTYTYHDDRNPYTINGTVVVN